MDSYQLESKSFLDDLVPRGARKAIAADWGVSEGYVSQLLNPHDERKNPIGEAKRLLDYLQRHAPEAHLAAKTFLGLSANEHVPEVDLAISLGAVAKEVGEAFHAQLNRKPNARKEWREAEIAVSRHTKQVVKVTGALRKVG